MNFGLFYWFGYRMANDACMELIRSAGFQSVMLWWGDEYDDFDGPKERMPETARRRGLDIDNIHAPFAGCNDIWLDTPEGGAVERMYLGCIDACAEHGIPAVVLHLTNGDAPPPPCQTGLDRLLRLAERAEKRGVDIALENLRKLEHLEYAYSNVDSPRFKFCYDSGHENCRTRGADLLEKYADRLCALHLHDNDGTADQHRIPGEGTVDWKRVKTALTASGYKGNVTFEVTNEFSPMYRDATAEQFLAAAYRKAVELFS
jgi:sugar phosphate isomerase/epimerase